MINKNFIKSLLKSDNYYFSGIQTTIALSTDKIQVSWFIVKLAHRGTVIKGQRVLINKVYGSWTLQVRFCDPYSADEIDLFKEPISISEEDIELIKQLKVTQNKHD